MCCALGHTVSVQIASQRSENPRAFASSLIRDYADETGPYQGLKERQRSKSILLKILNGKKERKKEKTSILSHLYFSVLPHAPVLFLN